MHKRTLLGLVPAAVLAGCGFRLRGVPEFSFSSLYIAAPATSALARELQRTLEGSGSPLKVLRNATDLTSAQAVIDLLSEQRERIALASEAFAAHSGGAAPKRVIVVPGRLVNVVV